MDFATKFKSYVRTATPLVLIGAALLFTSGCDYAQKVAIEQHDHSEREKRHAVYVAACGSMPDGDPISELPSNKPLINWLACAKQVDLVNPQVYN